MVTGTTPSTFRSRATSELKEALGIPYPPESIPLLRQMFKEILQIKSAINPVQMTCKEGPSRIDALFSPDGTLQDCRIRIYKKLSPSEKTRKITQIALALMPLAFFCGLVLKVPHFFSCYYKELKQPSPSLLNSCKCYFQTFVDELPSILFSTGCFAALGTAFVHNEDTLVFAKGFQMDKREPVKKNSASPMI